MPLELTSPSGDEPITLVEAKNYLKVDTADDDALITQMIAAARIRAEWYTGRAFTPQSWTLWLDRWPVDGLVEIPLPPLQAVTSIVLYAPDDTARTLDRSQYQVDAVSVPARLVLTGSLGAVRRMNAIAIAFTAGDDTLPPPVREAILCIAAYLYENRGEAPEELPFDALALLAPYRILKL
ncbi:MAG TPA: head-tail connector protein [Rhizomicrobium sp.]|nr:head-tail connector protein [Rhizomicrobium sp.]